MKIRKTLLSALLTLTISTALIPTLATAEWYVLPDVATATAVPIFSTVIVNGEEIEFDAYVINENTYFKLRDIAYTLRDTEKRFNVNYKEPDDWAYPDGCIVVSPKEGYVVVGGEMEGKSPGIKTVTFSGVSIYSPQGFSTEPFGSPRIYEIEGNNYIRLRDIAAGINFYVGWDGENNLITIDTSKFYVREAVAPPTVPTEETAYNRIIALKEYFPDGMEWSLTTGYKPMFGWTTLLSSGQVKEGSYHGQACSGFAVMLSEAAFGGLPTKQWGVHDGNAADYRDDFRVGDTVGYWSGPDAHDVVVLSISASGLVVAEGNNNSKVKWGREVSWAELNRYPEFGFTVTTRYVDASHPLLLAQHRWVVS
jgi:hypothetical protein